MVRICEEQWASVGSGTVGESENTCGCSGVWGCSVLCRQGSPKIRGRPWGGEGPRFGVGVDVSEEAAEATDCRRPSVAGKGWLDLGTGGRDTWRLASRWPELGALVVETRAGYSYCSCQTRE